MNDFGPSREGKRYLKNRGDHHGNRLVLFTLCKTLVSLIENKVHFIWRDIRMYFTSKWIFYKKNVWENGDFASYTNGGSVRKKIIKKITKKKKDFFLTW